MPVSFIGAMHQWFQGSTMVSGEREIEMTALPIGNSPSIRKLKIAIQKLTDRRTDDLSFFDPQKIRASHRLSPNSQEASLPFTTPSGTPRQRNVVR
jgi:hypothetical protein